MTLLNVSNRVLVSMSSYYNILQMCSAWTFWDFADTLKRVCCSRLELCKWIFWSQGSQQHAHTGYLEQCTDRWTVLFRYEDLSPWWLIFRDLFVKVLINLSLRFLLPLQHSGGEGGFIYVAQRSEKWLLKNTVLFSRNTVKHYVFVLLQSFSTFKFKCNILNLDMNLNMPARKISPLNYYRQ